MRNDPGKRDLNNIALLTSGSSRDVVWPIDEDGAFGRNAHFAIQAARPVVATKGCAR